MNCFECSIDEHDRSCSAVAICQQCGAGMCQDHLCILGGASPVGMVGSISRRLICAACNDSPIARTRKPNSNEGRQADTHQPWWNLWRNRKEAELPDPQEAVCAAERLLQAKRS